MPQTADPLRNQPATPPIASNEFSACPLPSLGGRSVAPSLPPAPHLRAGEAAGGAPSPQPAGPAGSGALNKKSQNTGHPKYRTPTDRVETAPLLDSRVVALTAGGWLPGYDRDFKTNPITPEERAMLSRATSNKGFHYSGEGRFFILVGKAFAETMQGLMEVKE